MIDRARIKTGCAAQGPVKPEQAVTAPAVAREPGVVRLADGREGFMITEIPKMDQAAQEDFQRAVALLDAHDYPKAIDLLEKVVQQSPGVTAPGLSAMGLSRFPALAPSEIIPRLLSHAMSPYETGICQVR